jgi:hypothetical protein
MNNIIKLPRYDKVLRDLEKQYMVLMIGIHELIANGKVNPGTIEGKRTQLCRFCGEETMHR